MDNEESMDTLVENEEIELTETEELKAVYEQKIIFYLRLMIKIKL